MMNVRKIGWGGVNWIYLAQDRKRRRAIVNTVMNLWVPQNVEKFFISRAIGGFSRKTQLHGIFS
jgi:hypothetical protein